MRDCQIEVISQLLLFEDCDTYTYFERFLIHKSRTDESKSFLNFNNGTFVLYIIDPFSIDTLTMYYSFLTPLLILQVPALH